MLYMQDFIRKISAINVCLIIKTCSASGALPPNLVSGGGALPPNPHQGLCPWTPLRDFRPQALITSPAFQFPPRIVGV